MIILEIYRNNDGRPMNIYIDEKTMTVITYEEGVTLDHINQTILLLQKTINIICNISFKATSYSFGNFMEGWIEGINNNDSIISSSDTYDYVNVCPYFNKCSIDWCCISHNDFKKLLMAQHKENELSYLLLKGVLK